MSWLRRGNARVYCETFGLVVAVASWLALKLPSSKQPTAVHLFCLETGSDISLIEDCLVAIIRL